MPNLVAVRAFNTLADDIGRLYEDARKVQVRFAWETGRRIVEVEQDGALRAAYGTRLILQLSEILSDRYGPGSGFSKTSLEGMRRFYLANRKTPPAEQLGWSHHVELLKIPDAKRRKKLEREAIQKGFKRDDVRTRVRQELEKDGQPPKALAPLTRPASLKLKTFARSKLNVRLPEGQVLLDCGFFVSWPVQKEDLAGLAVTDTPSYTYAATLERVVDGDTLLVLIEAGFGIIVRDKLRLRGINCPELGTPEGERAKKALETMIPVGRPIVIRSQKSDKYGRFVADIFYLGKDSAPEEILEKGVYLNQQLLDEGYAQRMRE